MIKQTAAQVDEVVAGQAKIVRLGGVEIGLFRLPDGEWRAYRNLCPHAGAPVCAGPVTDGVPPVLRCPWHAWDFDLTTGTLLGNAACRLESYRVEAEDGTLFVWA